MTEAYPARSASSAGHDDESAALSLTGWLLLAATPTFAGHGPADRPGREPEWTGLIPVCMRSSLVTSNVSWNRAKLWRGAVGEIEPYLVDVAPAPTFRRIITLDDWMAGGVKMFGGMAIG